MVAGGIFDDRDINWIYLGLEEEDWFVSVKNKQTTGIWQTQKERKE